MDSQAASTSAAHRAAKHLGSSRNVSVEAPVVRKHPRRRKYEATAVIDRFLLTRIRERGLGVWMLEAHHAGDVSLKLDGAEVAYIGRRHGASMLAVDACPYIRAAEIVTALISGLAVELSVRVRAEFEFALARWIPLYFDL
jgi:hypothetical protein